MSSNSILVLCSLFVVGLTVLFARLRSSRLDVADMYVLIVGIFFGGYTLIDALVKDFSRTDPILSALVILLVAFTAGLTWFVSRFLPLRLQRSIQVRQLAAQWAHVDSRIILLLLGLILIIQTYGYLHFGVISFYSKVEVARSGITLPYWFTSVASLIPTLLLCVFLAGTSRASISQGKVRLFWIVVLAVVVVLAGFYGRRSILYLVFVFLVLWSLMKGGNLISLRRVTLALALLLVLFVYSNVFQSYRSVLPGVSSTPFGLASSPVSFWEAAGNSEATLLNLKERLALWQFNYTILYEQTHRSEVEIPYGDIVWQGIMNALPSVFWAEKRVHDLDGMTAHLYGLVVTDYPTNNFAMTQADFGYLSVILLPLQLLFVFASMALFILATGRRPALLLLLSGIFLNYILSIEANYADFFILYRNVAVMTTIYLIGHTIVSLTPPVIVLRRRRTFPTHKIKSPP